MRDWWWWEVSCSEQLARGCRGAEATGGIAEARWPGVSRMRSRDETGGWKLEECEYGWRERERGTRTRGEEESRDREWER
jgi:hypothetical protein